MLALILCRLVVEFVLIFLAGVRDRSIYIYLYTCKPGQPRDYPPHLISPPLQGSVKMPCLPQTIKKYSHDLGPLLAGSILVVEVYGRAADCEDFWVFLQQ